MIAAVTTLSCVMKYKLANIGFFHVGIYTCRTRGARLKQYFGQFFLLWLSEKSRSRSFLHEMLKNNVTVLVWGSRRVSGENIVILYSKSTLSCARIYVHYLWCTNCKKHIKNFCFLLQTTFWLERSRVYEIVWFTELQKAFSTKKRLSQFFWAFPKKNRYIPGVLQTLVANQLLIKCSLYARKTLPIYFQLLSEKKPNLWYKILLENDNVPQNLLW